MGVGTSDGATTSGQSNLGHTAKRTAGEIGVPSGGGIRGTKDETQVSRRQQKMSSRSTINRDYREEKQRRMYPIGFWFGSWIRFGLGGANFC